MVDRIFLKGSAEAFLGEVLRGQVADGHGRVFTQHKYYFVSAKDWNCSLSISDGDKLCFYGVGVPNSCQKIEP